MMLSWTDILGLAAGVCTTVAVIPQIKKAWKTKKVKDVSPGNVYHSNNRSFFMGSLWNNPKRFTDNCCQRRFFRTK